MGRLFSKSMVFAVQAALSFGVLIDAALAKDDEVVQAQQDQAADVRGTGIALEGGRVQVGSKVFFLNAAVVPANAEGARHKLQQLLARGAINCREEAQSMGSVPTATCYVAGTELSAALIKSGMAFALPENGIDLTAHEEVARDTALGLWRGDLMRQHVEQVKNGSLAPRDCTIKGNKSYKAPYELKYHRVGDTYYSRTRINTKKGEYWYCSEVSARAAGFIPASTKTPGTL